MKKLKKIDPMSAAKVSALIGVIWGLVIGVLMLIGIGISQYMGRFFMGYQTVMPVTGAAAVIVLPIAYGITGFIGGYIGAVVYNFAAKQVGGVKVDLK